MIRLAVSVEGQTEEAFVNSVLAPHLRSREVYLVPVLFRGRGGNIAVESLAAEMVRLSRSFDAVTSLVDFYGFRGRENRSVDRLEESVGAAGDARTGGRGHGRMIPYIQKYEFEGLLFSDVTAFRILVHATGDSVAQLKRIRGRHRPEDIDDGRDTAPGRRIRAAIPRYRKRVDGPDVAKRIGLARIRAECPRFDAWVTRLERLAAER